MSMHIAFGTIPERIPLVKRLLALTLQISDDCQGHFRRCFAERSGWPFGAAPVRQFVNFWRYTEGVCPCTDLNLREKYDGSPNPSR